MVTIVVYMYFLFIHCVSQELREIVNSSYNMWREKQLKNLKTNWYSNKIDNRIDNLT